MTKDTECGLLIWCHLLNFIQEHLLLLLFILNCMSCMIVSDLVWIKWGNMLSKKLLWWLPGYSNSFTLTFTLFKTLIFFRLFISKFKTCIGVSSSCTVVNPYLVFLFFLLYHCVYTKYYSKINKNNTVIIIINTVLIKYVCLYLHLDLH